MTIVDTTDLENRMCRTCGAIAWDRVTHQRWHNRAEELEACVLELETTADRMIESLENARRLCVALEAELHQMQARRD